MRKLLVSWKFPRQPVSSLQAFWEPRREVQSPSAQTCVSSVIDSREAKPTCIECVLSCLRVSHSETSVKDPAGKTKMCLLTDTHSLWYVTCKTTQISHQLPFHNIMLLVETWDNIWKGMEKTTAEYGQHSSPLAAPMDLCVCLGCFCPTKPYLVWLFLLSSACWVPGCTV